MHQHSHLLAPEGELPRVVVFGINMRNDFFSVHRTIIYASASSQSEGPQSPLLDSSIRLAFQVNGKLRGMARSKLPVITQSLRVGKY